MVSVALIDDHAGLLRELKAIISEQEGYRVVDTGAAASAIPRIAKEWSPDLMIIDLSMPGDVFAAIAEARVLSPGTRLMVFTAYAEIELARRALTAGADAFVVKGLFGQDFFEAIAACLAGRRFVSQPLRARLEAGDANQKPLSPE